MADIVTLKALLEDLRKQIVDLQQMEINIMTFIQREEGK